MLIADYVAYLINYMATLLLSPGSFFSILSLACAGIIAATCLLVGDLTAPRKVARPTILKRLLPKAILVHPSTLMDLKLCVISILMLNGMFQFIIISYPALKNFEQALLVDWFGAMPVTTLSPLATAIVLTIALFIAFEFGYWAQHYLAHRVPFMWEFHKMHHTAEVLTPLTEWRTHPIETLVFFNATIISTATMNALVDYLFGRETALFTVASSNLIMVLFYFTLGHLQHSHLWLSFGGILGRLISSPAYHQIHHSMLPQHLDKNYGNHLAIWDWLFGTQYMPGKTREPLLFGVVGACPEAHKFGAGIAKPFADAAATLRPKVSAPEVTQGSRELVSAFDRS